MICGPNYFPSAIKYNSQNKFKKKIAAAIERNGKHLLKDLSINKIILMFRVYTFHTKIYYFSLCARPALKMDGRAEYEIEMIAFCIYLICWWLLTGLSCAAVTGFLVN